MPIVQPFVYIEPPPVDRYWGGLLDAALPIEQPSTHWEFGGVEFESLACYMSQTYPGGLNDINGAGGAKILPACMGVTQASAFAIYGGVSTGSLGHNENGNSYWTERARRIVELAGPRSVSAALWTGSGGGAPALNSATTPLVLAGQAAGDVAAAVDLVTAIGACEQWLVNNYAGRGMIHLPRFLAPFLAQLQLVKPDPDNPRVIVTTLGTKCVFGGGYDGSGPGAIARPGATYTGQLNAPTGLAGTPNASGGSFAAATYFWKVTAYDLSGETVGSNEVTNAVALNGTETLTWNATPGSAGYRIYRGTATNAETLIGTTTARTFTDSGSTGTTPIPTSNTTGTLAIAEQQYSWIYVTGEVLVLKGDIITPGGFAETLDRAGNQVRLFAEQPWLVAVDCAKAAILIRTQSIP